MSNTTITTPDSVREFVKWMYGEHLQTVVGVLTLARTNQIINSDILAVDYNADAYGAYLQPIDFIKGLCRLDGDSIIVFKRSWQEDFNDVDRAFVAMMRPALELLKVSFMDFILISPDCKTSRSFRAETLARKDLDKCWDVNFLYEKGLLK